MSSVVTLPEFVSMDRPKVHWLVPGLLPKPGIVILLGAPKVGKSFLALQIAMQLAGGVSILGHPPTVPCRVLYIQLDTSELVWRDRLMQLQQQGHTLPSNIFMAHPDILKPPAVITQPEVRDCLRQVLADSAPDLVVIDVFRKLHQHDENDSTAMKIINDHLAAIFGAYSVLMLHHTKKSSNPEGDAETEVILGSRGSTEISGNADAIWKLNRNSLHIVSRFAEFSTHQAQRTPGGFWHFGQPSPTESPDPDTRQEVVAALLKDHPQVPLLQVYRLNAEMLTAAGIGKTTFYRLASLYTVESDA
ncbi:regulatory protein repA [Caudoviricetes sp.]|nr:regulatory protein repA [Caudoviricetes sp.]UOF79645.1 regulatory protein repA [Caudoviricetes sp.]UOF79831.1 regulatory protein repA [Bacteriophage sp.]UOF81316.1 regulatory protein repA [Caudoviricetes sp.]